MIRQKIHGGNTLRIPKQREHWFLISSLQYREVKCLSSIKSSEDTVQGFIYLQRLKSYKNATVAFHFCRMQTVTSQNVYVREHSPISECPPRAKWESFWENLMHVLWIPVIYIYTWKVWRQEVKKKKLAITEQASCTFAVNKSQIHGISHCPSRQKREWPDNQPFHRNFANEYWLPPGQTDIHCHRLEIYKESKKRARAFPKCQAQNATPLVRRLPSGGSTKNLRA